MQGAEALRQRRLAGSRVVDEIGKYEKKGEVILLGLELFVDLFEQEIQIGMGIQGVILFI